MVLPDVSDLLGYAAAGLVLVAFYVRSLRALRSVAIASNLMFIAYATAAHLAPVLILHALLLPLNVWRLRQDFTSDQGTRKRRLEQSSRDRCVAARARRRCGRRAAGGETDRASAACTVGGASAANR